jgi:hypothetical protein
MLIRVVMTSVTSPLTILPTPAVTVTPAPASSRAWLAGNPGPPPSSASVVLILAILALTFAAVAVIAWPRQHHEAPLRRQMRAQPQTFRAGVDVRASYLGTMLPVTGPLYLVVRGDLVKVSHFFPPARFLFGQRYTFRAEDTTVKVVTGLRHDWIEIDGQGGTGARIWIWRPGMNRRIWNVLIDAGAHPIGLAPPP